MMKTMNKMIMMFVCLLLPLRTGAQNTPHWTVDPYAFQYDMTAYVSLTINGKPETEYTDFEVAAFCNGECRGITTIMTAGSGSDSSKYGYLRIRSNQSEGETITFKVYHKVAKMEVDINEVSVAFKSQDVVGLPSIPLLLNAELTLMGDANSDGSITTFDVTKVVSYILTGDEEGLNKRAVDMNGDGNITTFDAIQIVQLILSK